MTKDDEYRKQAADAEAMAARTAKTTDKEAWRRIAQGWMSLIRRPKKTAQENTAQATTALQSFDDAVQEQTGRHRSKEPR